MERGQLGLQHRTPSCKQAGRKSRTAEPFRYITPFGLGSSHESPCCCPSPYSLKQLHKGLVPSESRLCYKSMPGAKNLPFLHCYPRPRSKGHALMLCFEVPIPGSGGGSSDCQRDPVPVGYLLLSRIANVNFSIVILAQIHVRLVLKRP
jgi:hypothetical protein